MAPQARRVSPGEPEDPAAAPATTPRPETATSRPQGRSSCLSRRSFVYRSCQIFPDAITRPKLKFVTGPRLAHDHGENRAQKEDLMAEPENLTPLPFLMSQIVAGGLVNHLGTGRTRRVHFSCPTRGYGRGEALAYHGFSGVLRPLLQPRANARGV